MVNKKRVAVWVLIVALALLARIPVTVAVYFWDDLHNPYNSLADAECNVSEFVDNFARSLGFGENEARMFQREYYAAACAAVVNQYTLELLSEIACLPEAQKRLIPGYVPNDDAPVYDAYRQGNA